MMIPDFKATIGFITDSSFTSKRVAPRPSTHGPIARVADISKYLESSDSIIIFDS
jgi:hypothetical protein